MNIQKALNILSEHLQTYNNDLKGNVFIENIAEKSNDGVNITLIKVEEEAVLKNGKYSKVTLSQKVEYKNRPVYANLFILFSTKADNYFGELTLLSQVVEFFQGKNVFTHYDGISPTSLGDNKNDNEQFKIILELQNQSLEQVNHLWGFLGGKQKPAVLYRARIIPLIAKDKVNAEGEPILQININGNPNL